jgi:hypothetical protein
MRRWAWAVLILLILAQGIIARAQQPRTPFSGDYHLEAGVSKVQPFINEPVIYTLRFYAASAVNYTLREPAYGGFYVAGQLTTSAAEIINQRQHLVVSMSTVLIPLDAGPLTIEPARLIVPATIFADSIMLESEPVTLDVLPPPAAAPDGFTGAIGRYDVLWRVDATTAAVGSPVMLRYRVSGSGGLPVISRPVLDMPEFWRAYPQPSEQTLQFQGGPLIGERIFEWLLIPDRAGSATFDAQPFVFFDPEVMRYETIRLPPLTVEVIPAAGGALETTRFDRTLLNRTLPLLSVNGEPRRMDDAPNGAALILWVVPPLLFAGVRGGQRARMALMEYRRRAQTRRAFRAALRALDRAAALTGEGAFAAVEQALVGYAADRSGGEPVSPDALAERVIAAGLAPALAQRFEDCALRAREMRYARPQDMPDSGAMIREAAAVLREVEQAWPR